VPFTTMLAERAAPVLAAKLYPTDPLPVPEAPDVTVRNAALLAAVHEHVDAAVTGTVPVLAAAPTLVVVVPSVTVHALDGAAAAVSFFEHADAARVTATTTIGASQRR